MLFLFNLFSWPAMLAKNYKRDLWKNGQLFLLFISVSFLFLFSFSLLQLLNSRANAQLACLAEQHALGRVVWVAFKQNWSTERTSRSNWTVEALPNSLTT